MLHYHLPYFTFKIRAIVHEQTQSGEYINSKKIIIISCTILGSWLQANDKTSVILQRFCDLHVHVATVIMASNQSKKPQSVYGAVSRLIKVKAGLNIDLNAKCVSARHNETNKNHNQRTSWQTAKACQMLGFKSFTTSISSRGTKGVLCHFGQ